jgi:hypothetical protein
MVNLGGLGGALGGVISSSEGKEQIIKFITSPEGIAMLQQFLGSPQGKPVAAQLLMPILGTLNVPDGVKQSLQQYAGK